MTAVQPFPNMTVELRESDTAHGIPAPSKRTQDIAMQLQETMIMNQDALVGGWPESTLEILKKYINKYLAIPTDAEELIQATQRVTGLMDWKEVSVFVQKDACSEFFNMALKHCQAQQQDPTDTGLDFLDGTGFGYLKYYTEIAYEIVQRCFDAKYYYNTPRPLVYMLEKHKIDLRPIANHLHPGHWSYPAGHGTKFLAAVQVLDELYALSGGCYREIFIAACVCSMGRTGNFIHYPEDNLAGGYLTTLKEFQKA